MQWNNVYFKRFTNKDKSNSKDAFVVVVSLLVRVFISNYDLSSIVQ